jgi:hypothetical protein
MGRSTGFPTGCFLPHPPLRGLVGASGWPVGLLSVALLLTGCTGRAVPPSESTGQPTLAAPAPSSTVTFDVVAPMTAPSQVRLGQKVVLSVALENVTTQAATPWFGISDLFNVASLVGCLPACTRRGSFYGLEYLQLPPAPAADKTAFRLIFRAQKAATVQYTVIVSGQPKPLLADADHAWTLDLTIVP